MFHEQFIKPHDKALFLKLLNWGLVERAPKNLAGSRYSYKLSYSTMKGYDPSNVDVMILPQVSLSAVLSLVRSIRAEAKSILLEKLAALFRLGLGVPKMTTIARYLEEFDREDEDFAGTVQSICDLVEHHVDKLLDSNGGYDYAAYAQYQSTILNFGSMIAHKQNEGKKKFVLAPKGTMVALVYQSSSALDEKFNLVGGFRFTEKGVPINFDHVVMRPSFNAAPKALNSKSLRGHSSYVVVTGVLYWENDKHNIKQMLELAHHPEDVLLINHANILPQALRQELKEIRKESNLTYEARQLVSKYSGGKVPKSKRKAVKQAKAFLTEDRVQELHKRHDQHDKKVLRELQKSGPVSSCKFCALDLGLIQGAENFQHVKTKLSKVWGVLEHYKFETLNSVKATMPEDQMRKLKVVTTTQKTRIWVY